MASVLILFNLITYLLFVQCNVFTDLHKIAGGGDPLPISNAPFMAFYRDQDQNFVCGASIVHERFLLSAAHCYTLGFKYNATLSSDNLRRGGQHYAVAKVIIHPRYRPELRGYDYDISLIKLRRSIKFGPKVQKITMAPRNTVIKPGTEFVVMGFGDQYYDQNQTSDRLLHARVPYVELSKCTKLIPKKYSSLVTERMICAGGNGLDACQGDSGGPLVYQNILVGVVSWGYKCATKSPGLYTTVSLMRDFIDRTILSERSNRQVRERAKSRFIHNKLQIL